MTEQAKWPVKRPLAFAIETHKGNWILYNDEEIAAKVADEKGLDYHGLFLRDGCAGIIAQRDQLVVALKEIALLAAQTPARVLGPGNLINESSLALTKAEQIARAAIAAAEDRHD